MKNILFISLILCSIGLFAQTVTITTIGSGATKGEAEISALRSAIEQTFGAYITSNTVIFDDELVSDEIASIANGNIESYKILNKEKFHDNSWMLTVSSTISVNKLMKFVESKGGDVTLNGSAFASNIQQMELNRTSEEKVISNMIKYLSKYMSTSYDYLIDASEPIKAKDDMWQISLSIKVLANDNMNVIREYVYNTLGEIGLSSKQIGDIRGLGEQVYCLKRGGFVTYCLRSDKSIELLGQFASELFKATTYFSIKPHVRYTGYTKHSSDWYYNPYWYHINNGTGIIDKTPTLFLPKKNKAVVTFHFIHKMSLNNIKKLTGYEVKPSKTKYMGIDL